VKTDPPPQYKMLSSGTRNEEQATADASDRELVHLVLAFLPSESIPVSDTTGDESRPPTPSPAPKPESNTEFIEQKVERKHGMSGELTSLHNLGETLNEYFMFRCRQGQFL
jgi:hypothetical protein